MATETETATTPAPAEVEHEDHPAHLEHHFVSSEQQFDSAKLGMWLFLITEVLLFSGMFVAYAVYRQWHPEAFVEASATLNTMLGTINTIVLLTSSLTVAFTIMRTSTDERVADGEVSFVFVNETVEATPLPDTMRECIRDRGDAVN